jgi:hypothetical protein
MYFFGQNRSQKSHHDSVLRDGGVEHVRGIKNLIRCRDFTWSAAIRESTICWPGSTDSSMLKDAPHEG